MKIIMEVSNRHMHLTKEVYDLLFDEEMSKIKDLSQTGEFASDKMVSIITEKGVIDNVRVIGPLRSYNQVEISRKDAIKLGINPPVRESGDLSGAERITVKTPKGEYSDNICILAQRHVHMNYEDAKKYNVSDKEKVKIKIDGDRSGIIDAYIKLSGKGVMVAHIDTDDAAAFLINQGDEKELIIDKKD